MDFEDFEFKPLTEGLGFHKKNPSKVDAGLNPFQFDIKSDLKVDFIQPEKKIELPELAPEINIFSKPLPRTEQDVPQKKVELETPVTSIPKFNPRFTKPLANPAIRDQKVQDAGLLGVLTQHAEKTETLKPNKVEQAPEVKFVEAAPAPLSLFLDMTVISGLSILFTLGLVVATGIDIVPIFNNALSDAGTQIGIVLLVYSVSQLYLILSRSFFGQTLGEWSMDTQLGLPVEQQKISYVFKLISRTLILALTGFITLPLISILTGKDLAGRAASLKLYTR